MDHPTLDRATMSRVIMNRITMGRTVMIRAILTGPIMIGPIMSRLGASPGFSHATEPGLAPKRLNRSVIMQEVESLDAEAAEVLETIRGLV